VQELFRIPIDKRIIYGVVHLAANGPAIKGVSVAERLEAGGDCPLIARQFFGGRNERSMARFLPSSCKLFELYECRGTMFIESRSPVPLHRFDWEQRRCHGNVPLYCVLL